MECVPCRPHTAESTQFHSRERAIVRSNKIIIKTRADRPDDNGELQTHGTGIRPIDVYTLSMSLCTMFEHSYASENRRLAAQKAINSFCSELIFKILI